MLIGTGSFDSWCRWSNHQSALRKETRATETDWIRKGGRRNGRKQPMAHSCKFVEHSCNSRVTWTFKSQIPNDPPNKVCPIGSRCFDLYTGSHLELRLLVLMATWGFHSCYRFALSASTPGADWHLTLRPLYLLPSSVSAPGAN